MQKEESKDSQDSGGDLDLSKNLKNLKIIKCLKNLMDTNESGMFLFIKNMIQISEENLSISLKIQIEKIQNSGERDQETGPVSSRRMK